MASFDVRKPEPGGNGPSYLEILKSLGLTFLASLLPLISARLVEWSGRKLSPPLVEPKATEPPAPAVPKPDLPPLTELPRGDS